MSGLLDNAPDLIGKVLLSATYGFGIGFVMGLFLGSLLGIPMPLVGILVGIALATGLWYLELDPAWDESREESERLTREAAARSAYEEAQNAYDVEIQAAERRDAERSAVRENFKRDAP
jgi:hypothetical protein